MSLYHLQKVRDFLLATLSFLILSATSVYVYSAFIEEPFLSYHNLPFPITKTVYPGDAVEFFVARCNSSKEIKQLVSTRALVPEDVTMKTTSFEYVFVNVIPGCSPPVPLLNVIPIGTLPGFYRYKGKSQVQGLVVEHSVEWNTDVVQVLEKLTKDKP